VPLPGAWLLVFVRGGRLAGINPDASHHAKAKAPGRVGGGRW
jgi:hypothetical protein